MHEHPVKRVKSTDIDALLAKDDSLLLDCRNVRDYQHEHIDRALHSHDGLIEGLIRKGDKNRTIVIYCYHGHSSEHLAELLGNFGFTEVYSMEGGFESWKKNHPSSPE